MVRRERGSSVDHHYLHRDHLGSITAVINETNGQIVERYSYDAWGKRRTATNWQAADITTALNYRGYTGHEHLDDVGIIHMNGRIYLPKLGKMMSPDPITQSPENGQNYSRYSYVFNNPLKFTDPSGYKSDIDRIHIKPIITNGYGVVFYPPRRVRFIQYYTEDDRDRRSAAEIMGSSFGISDYISNVYQSGARGSNEPRERRSDDPRNARGDDGGSDSDNGSSVGELTDTGGIARIISGLVDVNQSKAISNLIHNASDADIKRLFPHLEAYSGLELSARKLELINELKSIRVQGVRQVVLGGLEATADLTLEFVKGRSVGYFASKFGVSRHTVRILDLSFADPNWLSESEMERRNLIDELREKYD